MSVASPLPRQFLEFLRGGGGGVGRRWNERIPRGGMEFAGEKHASEETEEAGGTDEEWGMKHSQ